MGDASSTSQKQHPESLLHELESHKAEIAAAAVGVALLAATHGKVSPTKVVDLAQDGLRFFGVGADSELANGLKSLKEFAGGRTDAALLRKARWMMPEQVDHVTATLGKPTAAKVIDVGWRQAIAVKHGERGTSLLLKEEDGVRVVTAGADGSFSTMTPAKGLLESNAQGTHFNLPGLELTGKADSLAVKTANGSKSEMGIDGGAQWHGRFNDESVGGDGKTGKFDLDSKTSFRSYTSPASEKQSGAGQNFLVEARDRGTYSWINTQGADGYSVRHQTEATPGFTFTQLQSGAKHLAIGSRANPLASFRVDVNEGANVSSARPEQASHKLYVKLPDLGYANRDRYKSVDKLLESK